MGTTIVADAVFDVVSEMMAMSAETAATAARLVKPDRYGNGLGEPVDDGEGEYGGKRLLALIKRQRQEVHDEECNGSEKEPVCLPYPLESLLRGGEHLPLLCERLVSSGRPHALCHGSPPVRPVATPSRGKV